MHTPGGHDGSARMLAASPERPARPELLAELVLPADADSLGLARLATMHVAGLLGLPISRLAELRLAVNEACALLVQPPSGAPAAGLAVAESLRLRFERQDGRLSIAVCGPAPYRSPDLEEIGWLVLRALVDEVQMDTSGEISTLTLREPLSATVSRAR